MTMYNVYIQQDRLEHYKPRHATTKFKRHVSSHQRRCDQIVTRATSEEIYHPEIARFAIAVVAFRGSCMAMIFMCVSPKSLSVASIVDMVARLRLA